MCKYWGWTEDYVLDQLTWQNLVMYLATIPKYDEDDTSDDEYKDNELFKDIDIIEPDEELALLKKFGIK